MPNYTLAQKIDALDMLAECETLTEAAEKTGINASTLSAWRSHERDLRREHNQRLSAIARRKMLQAQHQLAERTADILAAMDEQRISKAPLNQLSSALGVLIDRYLKLQETVTEDDNGEQTFRFEFVYPDGTVHDAPPWTTLDSGEDGTFYSRDLWAAIWKNRVSQGIVDGQSLPSWYEDMVASADVSDGGASMARLKDDDDRRNWSGY